jgi:hypothetical protein
VGDEFKSWAREISPRSIKKTFQSGGCSRRGKKDEPDTKIGHFKIQLTSEFIRFVQSEEAMSLEFAMTVI